jgi:metal-responsive CopG/Arc/MetJ family transcriptional regulator
MSRIIITIPNELMDELMAIVEAKSKTEAVENAIKHKIKQRKRSKTWLGKSTFLWKPTS